LDGNANLEKIAYKHYLRALSRWPKDPLRPETQFQDAIRRRIDRQFLPASSSDPAKAVQKVPNSSVDEKLELENVNILYSLLENRYTRKVRSSQSIEEVLGGIDWTCAVCYFRESHEANEQSNILYRFGSGIGGSTDEELGGKYGAEMERLFPDEMKD
jgi:hypothetical protein